MKQKRGNFMNIVEMLVFVAYFLFMLGIGVFFFLKSKDAGERVPGYPPCPPVLPT